MKTYFKDIEPISYQGPDTDNPLSFRWYDKDRIVLGRRMEEQLRFSVCYWHTFCWNGFDPFGYVGTIERPWFGASDAMEAARHKASEAFDFMSKLGAPFYCFHDRDVAPQSATPQQTVDNLRRMVDILADHQERTNIRLLWGTAGLVGQPHYMAGAATSPDPEVFAQAALQVRECLDATKRLGGHNYVLWGGREGYETLLNTNIKQELDQMGRFLSMVVEYKHKIGFEGTILVEPKPREPMKHQYDFDVATVYGFLLRYGLEKEVKVNIEANHATLAGHAFEDEIAMAISLGAFGSIDINRGDQQCGWDTDQFANNVGELALAMYHIFKAGGFTTGGLNCDARIRRQSIEPVDLFYGHIGAMDSCARALLCAEKMIQDGGLAEAMERRYASWKESLGQKILAGRVGIDELADYALSQQSWPRLHSGRQEYLENLVNRFL